MTQRLSLSDNTLARVTRAVMKPRAQVKLIPGDCVDVLSDLEDESVHMVLTDPPYFLDGLDSDWSKGNGKTTSTGTIGTLPVGMKFDSKQSRKLREFLAPVVQHLYRIIKPGGFVLMFSAPRLVHSVMLPLEDAGFELRDQYAWRFTRRAQFKAFSMDHFVKKMKDKKAGEKKEILKQLGGRKTPQLRPEFESIVLAQKPREGTFINNWLKHEVGLVDTSQTLKGTAPSTVMTVEKDLKLNYNCHLTPKPLRICEHLIRLFSKKGQVVLDPFLGSGTSCVAAYKSNRHCIGIDINPDYIGIANKRIQELYYASETNGKDG